MAAPRACPDFLIIGARKSGTTSLHAWLARQPELFLPANKEPEFFSHEDIWKRGLGWYQGLFSDAGPHQLIGEASVNYTNPRYAAVAAPRILATNPRVRLVFVARNPVERLRSHYRHAVLRNRESRSLVEAVSEPGNRYVGQSLYSSCLAPYLEEFADEQLCVVRFEDLFSESEAAWHQVLAHLGLVARPAPGSHHNASSDKARFSPAMRFLSERGLGRRANWVPAPLRKLAKRTLTAATSADDLAASRAPLPAEVLSLLFEDADKLARRIGFEGAMWEPTASVG